MLLLLGCTRDQETDVCADIVEGEVVVTEIRGRQQGAESFGQWIELFNTTDGELDLRGLRIDVARLSGSGFERILFRTGAPTLPPGEYLVAGHHGPRSGDVPDFVDYPFFPDYHDESDGILNPKALHGNGTVRVFACDELIDRVVYQRLPNLGSLSLDGNIEPTSKANDDADAWCTDEEEQMLDPGEPQLFIGTPGTPGEANRPCE